MNKKAHRLLAAIMFTDMVGYTALMQEDEAKAKKNRDRHRKILKTYIYEFNGEILQYYGDGTLIIFKSAIEAVDCAVQIQMELQKEPKIPLRIGIHTGDIVCDDEGVFGDSVNVASRIENLAVSGSVLITGKVFDDIKNHNRFSTESLGTFDLKNVKKPIEVYAIINEGLFVPSAKDIKSRQKYKLKSIAILPFVNISADPENEYFSDGITEELLNALARVEGLQVTARTSSFAFKGKNIDIKQIGIQLGAKSILEGSVRKAGNKVRITAQLINTADGYHVWSETFDRQLDDIFQVQDEIARKIINKLREKLTLESEKIAIVKSPTHNIEAYNTYLIGLFHSYKWTIEDTEIAIKEFNKAIDLEPDFALPYNGLSHSYIYLGASGKKPIKSVLPLAKEYALKAIKLDNMAAESHAALARVYFYLDWNWDKVYQLAEKAISINPSYSGAYLIKALCFNVNGKFKEAILSMRKSVELDPLFVPGHYAFAVILACSGRYKEASEQLGKLFEISPHFPDALYLQGLVYHLLGDDEKAMVILYKAQKIPEYFAFAYSLLGGLHANMRQIDKAKQYLEKLLTEKESLQGQQVLFHISYLYAALDQPDLMFQYLNKSVDAKDNYVLYILGYPIFNKYYSDSRFNEILKRIGISQ